MRQKFKVSHEKRCTYTYMDMQWRGCPGNYSSRARNRSRSVNYGLFTAQRKALPREQ